MYYDKRQKPRHAKRSMTVRVMQIIILAVVIILSITAMYFFVTYGIKRLDKTDEQSDVEETKSTVFDTTPVITSTTTIPKEVKEVLSLITPKVTVWNMAEEKMEYQSSSEAQTSPANLTLIWAAKTALNAVDGNTVFTVGPEIKLARATAPTAYLKQGQKLKLHMLVDAMLVSGGEDAAYVIAVNCGRIITGVQLSEEPAVTVFIDEMNRYASKLGVENTKFANITGEYNEKQVTTASDMSMLIKDALGIDQIKKALGKRTVRHVYISGEDVTWFSSLEILKPDNPFYSEFVKGAFLGYTKEDGYSACAVVEINKKEYLVVLLGAKAPGELWEDLFTLLEKNQSKTKTPTTSLTNTTDNPGE